MGCRRFVHLPNRNPQMTTKTRFWYTNISYDQMIQIYAEIDIDHYECSGTKLYLYPSDCFTDIDTILKSWIRDSYGSIRIYFYPYKTKNKQGKSGGFDSCDRPSNLKLDSNRRFFRPCDREIWWMTSKNNRALLLYYVKLCTSFQIHLWIQTGVTVRKRSIRVKNGDILCPAWLWYLMDDLEKQ